MHIPILAYEAAFQDKEKKWQLSSSLIFAMLALNLHPWYSWSKGSNGGRDQKGYAEHAHVSWPLGLPNLLCVDIRYPFALNLYNIRCVGLICGHSIFEDTHIWVIYGTIELKSVHQKDTHHNKIELCVNFLVIVIGSIVNTIWREYVISIYQ
jgi:hypothetical protein